MKYSQVRSVGYVSGQLGVSIVPLLSVNSVLPHCSGCAGREGAVGAEGCTLVGSEIVVVGTFTSGASVVVAGSATSTQV